MGKKQHQKDRLHLTCTEWAEFYGGKKTKSAPLFKRLPYNCCSLTFQPYDTPYCTKEGVIFDLSNILPFLKKYGVNPVSGDKITAKHLIKLSFSKNAEGKDHCPITYKVFTESTHIVAVGTTGNVYAWDAVDKLNITPNNWKDLIDDTPFTRKDLIDIQNPTQLNKFDITQFFHVQRNLRLDDPSKGMTVRSANQETRDTLSALQRSYQGGSLAAVGAASSEERLLRQPADSRLNAALYSTGAVAASLTSTSVTPSRSGRQQAARLEDDTVRYARIKKSGFVRLATSHGHLNLELFCQHCPKTCDNFLQLCQRGYYTDTIFHRSVRNFVLQGGDPTGTGHGGDSAWGGAFKDEIHLPSFTHEGRGVLSMANSGKDTNKSQFFITYRSAKHLNGKHTVFGKLVGGVDTLDAIEKIEVDKHDKPIEEVRVLAVQIFTDPYSEVDALLAAEREAEEASRPQAPRADDRRAPAAAGAGAAKLKVYRPGAEVGKFVNLRAAAGGSGGNSSGVDSAEPVSKKKKKQLKSALSDFSAW